MPLRYDPLLVRALAREVAARWGGARAVELRLDRSARAAELRFQKTESLGFRLDPRAGYLLPGCAVNPEARFRFRDLRLGAAAAAADERTLRLPLVDGRGRLREEIVVELRTHRWNLLLLAAPPEGGEPAEGSRGAGEDGEDRAGGGVPTDSASVGGSRIRAALWPRQAGGRALRAGGRYELPRSPRAGAESPLSLEAWLERLAPLPAADRRAAALEGVAYMSPLNVDWVLGCAGRPEAPEAGDAALRKAYERYRSLLARGAEAARAEGEPGAWLLVRPWGAQPYVAPLDEADAAPAASLLEAMARAAAAGAGTEPEEARLRAALLGRRSRLDKRKQALLRQLTRAGEAADLRAEGNLLLARLREVPRGAASVTLEDFDGTPRQIRLDPALDAAANAGAYFDAAARRERAARRLPPEIAAAGREIEEVDAALRGLAETGPDEALWRLAGGRPPDRSGARPYRAGGAGPDAGGGPPEERKFPYLRYRTSGGLELRVGRDSRSNDALTFRHSSPEDIWLHARQTQGAHVVLRWGRREENPPARDLREAALAAAVHSGARHSGTVPVDWTRRKYVRKPRKAPPGTVLPERVKTIFVEPDAERLKKLREG
ncbi:MAG: NFACT RNA binding domain-containing protein [Gemmatimonadota bacterium]